MHITFRYDRTKDADNLFDHRWMANTDERLTRRYQQIVERYGKNPTREDVLAFIDEYIQHNKINTDVIISKFQTQWNPVESEYLRRAKNVFGIELSADITAYLTISGRCPYSIKENYIYVTMMSEYVTRSMIHELWHFFTYHALGPIGMQKLSPPDYFKVQEVLTVLINVECADLLPTGITDTGYPQHAQLRAKVIEMWQQEKDIKKIWRTIAAEQYNNE